MAIPANPAKTAAPTGTFIYTEQSSNRLLKFCDPADLSNGSVGWAESVSRVHGFVIYLFFRAKARMVVEADM